MSEYLDAPSSKHLGYCIYNCIEWRTEKRYREMKHGKKNKDAKENSKGNVTCALTKAQHLLHCLSGHVGQGKVNKNRI